MTTQPETNPATPQSTMLYSVVEAAQQLRICRSIVYQLISSGELRSLKIGSRRLITHEDLQAFIKHQLEQAA